MKLPEVIERLLGLEKKVDQLEQAKTNMNRGLMEAMLREQMRKQQKSPIDAPDWFETRFR